MRSSSTRDGVPSVGRRVDIKPVGRGERDDDEREDSDD